MDSILDFYRDDLLCRPINPERSRALLHDTIQSTGIVTVMFDVLRQGGSNHSPVDVLSAIADSYIQSIEELSETRTIRGAMMCVIEKAELVLHSLARRMQLSSIENDVRTDLATALYQFIADARVAICQPVAEDFLKEYQGYDGLMQTLAREMEDLGSESAEDGALARVTLYLLDTAEEAGNI